MMYEIWSLGNKPYKKIKNMDVRHSFVNMLRLLAIPIILCYILLYNVQIDQELWGITEDFFHSSHLWYSNESDVSSQA